MKTLRFLVVPALLFVACGSVGTIALADYSTVVLGDNPLGYWPLNEASGTTVHDLSTQGFSPVNGTQNNGVTVGVPGIPGLTPALAASYNGTNQNATIVPANNYYTPNIPGAGTGWTAEVWIKEAAGQPNYGDALIWYDQATGHDLYQIYLDPAGKADAYVRGDTDSGTGLTSTSLVDDNNWHQVVLTFGYTASNAPFENLYVDGNLQATAAVALSTFSGGGPLLSFGSHPLGNTYFAGSLDAPSIYGTALSGTQILDQYNAGIGSPVPEPSSIVLGLSGFAAIFVVRRFRRRSEG